VPASEQALRADVDKRDFGTAAQRRPDVGQ
jgi:hypothetical protein